MRDAAVEAQALDILLDGGEGRAPPCGPRRSTVPIASCPPRSAAARSAMSPTRRQTRCTKRPAPCTPSSVQITSRSGGESESMNQRAVSAP